MIDVIKLIKNTGDARDYIEGLEYETLRSVIESKDKVVFDNSIIDDFYNYCKNIDYCKLNVLEFKNIKSCWITSLTSVILNYVDLSINE